MRVLLILVFFWFFSLSSAVEVKVYNFDQDGSEEVVVEDDEIVAEEEEVVAEEEESYKEIILRSFIHGTVCAIILNGALFVVNTVRGVE
jgi:hypothetical protein